VVINDPENNNRHVISLIELDSMATKSSDTDEVGGNTAIIPVMNKFSSQTRLCPNCGKDIDMSFSHAANTINRIVDQDLCQSCDFFSLTPYT